MFTGNMCQGLVRIYLWHHPYDDPEIEYFEMPLQMLDPLRNYIETGLISPELREGLQAALGYFPLWGDSSLSSITLKEQRESIAGKFVIENGRKLDTKFDMSLGVILY